MTKTNAAAPKTTRPDMPAGYGIAKGAKGQLDWSWATERLAASKNYWIVTVRPDGRPHAMPVWGVSFNDTVYFSTAPDSRKGLNLAANPNLLIHLESGDEAVVLEGTVAKVTEQADFDQFDDLYAAKYGGIRPARDMGTDGIYRLDLRVALGWAESSFPNTATRWQFGPPA